jgi:ubiquinone/menaquinone biosynthesis C-methylase UbiE
VSDVEESAGDAETVAPDPEAERARMAEHWEQAAAGWGRCADVVRDSGMPASQWLIEHLDLQPGETLLELAAGPGDTGFMAAELIQPGGALISSDGSEPMIEVARGRAAKLGVPNVEFKQLQLEWIDLETATVDAVICRWGIMLTVDPAAAAREIRRVLRPGGRATLAVWDSPEVNPWATTPTRAMIELGHSEPPDPNAPGMFSLAEPGKLQSLLEEAGFTDVVTDAVAVPRDYDSLDHYLDEIGSLSGMFARAMAALTPEQRAEVKARMAEIATPFTDDDGSIHFAGRTLVALARA